MSTKSKRSAEPTQREATALQDVALMTMAIREYQEGIVSVATKRKKRVAYLCAQGFTYAVIAEAVGLSENGIYKIMREKPEGT